MGKATTCFGPSYLNKMHAGGTDDRELMHPPRNSGTARRHYVPDSRPLKGGAFADAYNTGRSSGMGKENAADEDFNFSVNKGLDTSYGGGHALLGGPNQRDVSKFIFDFLV